MRDLSTKEIAAVSGSASAKWTEFLYRWDNLQNISTPILRPFEALILLAEVYLFNA
jgi:hypothetical protein